MAKDKIDLDAVVWGPSVESKVEPKMGPKVEPKIEPIIRLKVGSKVEPTVGPVGIIKARLAAPQVQKLRRAFYFTEEDLSFIDGLHERTKLTKCAIVSCAINYLKEAIGGDQNTG